VELWRKNITALIMDEKWIKTHVAFCVTKHLESGPGMQGISSVINRLGRSTLGLTLFIENVAIFILDSNDPAICLAKRCVQEAIVFSIVERNGSEPRVPGLYAELAATAIAKHIWEVYKGL
jgi:hypothetical protein